MKKSLKDASLASLGLVLFVVGGVLYVLFLVRVVLVLDIIIIDIIIVKAVNLLQPLHYPLPDSPSVKPLTPLPSLSTPIMLLSHA